MLQVRIRPKKSVNFANMRIMRGDFRKSSNDTRGSTHGSVRVTRAPLQFPLVYPGGRCYVPADHEVFQPPVQRGQAHPQGVGSNA